LVGSIQFAYSGARINVAYANNKIAQYVQNPGVPYINVAKRVLKYLKGHHDTRITFKAGPVATVNQLHAYNDADYIGDLNDRKS